MDKNFASFYLNYLKIHFSGLNLTRITEPDEFYEKQILDSIAPFIEDDSLGEIVSKLGNFIDIGFGGGFPILPLREFFLPNIKMFGVDSKMKKVNAVKKISSAYGQKNIRFIHSRIEKLQLDIPCFLTLKAVGDINKMLPMLNCASNTHVLFYKAKNLLELEPHYKNNAGWKHIKTIKYNVGKNDRYFVLFKRLKNSKPDKSLVKLSDFVFN